jgi:amidase
MVPIAHGSDGGGSIRIPAAACGLVGIKPGSGVIPGAPGGSGWCGLSSDGPLATTVDDLALTLSVMASRPDLASVTEPARPLRIALSVRPSLPGANVDPAYEAAARETGALLALAGHTVTEADPPYNKMAIVAMGLRSTAGIAQSAQGLARSSLERRSRPMVRMGRIADRLGLVRDSQRESWRQSTTSFFADFDVLVTPALAGIPPVAEGWSRKSFLANARAGSFGAFTGVWNLAGYPAAAVPAGFHPTGMPLSVQIVAPDGGEALVLAVAKQLERLRPWPRYAPMAGVDES